jgi:sugar lactone lactonase YvrE
VDASGNLFISDSSNLRIRKVTPDGVISTVAGNGTGGFTGDGGLATAARLSTPSAVAVDVGGNLFISDRNNHRVRKVTPDGVISTVAGIGTNGFSGDGGPATAARLSFPSAVAVDGAGNLFIAGSNRVRKVTPDGVISTIAGDGTSGFSGDGGPATAAQIANPVGLAADGAGNLFVVTSNRIRKITADGIISTVAGTGTPGFSGDGGPATAALLVPSAVAVDTSGTLLIAEPSNHRVRKVTADGVISTVAGNGTSSAFFAGDGGPAISASLNYPSSVAVDSTGNVLIADTSNSRIRKVAPTGVINTLAGNGSVGSGGDGGPATSAQLNSPVGVTIDQTGNVFIADCSNRIRKVSPPGTISTFAAVSTWDLCYYDYYNYYSSGGGIAADTVGNVFITDPSHHQIYKVTPDGVVSVIAGTGRSGFLGDGGPASSAWLSYPSSIAVDATGNLFITDTNNNRIRKVTPDGIIRTVAGSPISGFSGDGGPATSARLSSPTGIAVDTAGNLFIADTYNNRIRKVTPDGIISTVAGNGASGFSGDGGPATSARLNYPSSVAVDAAGNLFIADTNNSRIRRVGLALTVPTLTGVSLNFAAQGANINVALAGTSFASPLTVNGGPGVTVSNVTVVTDVLATATLTIAPNAAVGVRSLSLTTSLGTSNSIPFTIVTPFPDLSIISSHTGNLGVGSSADYTVRVTNVGGAATTGPMTMTDTLPFGWTFVSGIGSGWLCSGSGRSVTCTNTQLLAASESTTLTLTIAVGRNSASGVIHTPKVATPGDLVNSNNTTSDATTVALPAVTLQFTPQQLAAGGQATLGLTVPVAFQYEVAGTLKLAFSPNAVVPVDDPAIQFATGGREVTFTIPANTVQARFGDNPQAGPIAFQAGTVAGALSFNGTIQTGTVETAFSGSRTIPQQVPAIHGIQTEPRSNTNVFVAISLSSTLREVTELNLRFNTQPAIRLSCGDAAGCSVSGNVLTFDVKALFDAWFAADTQFGSLSVLRVPFAIQGSVSGSVLVSLRNRLGGSNAMSVPLP